MTVAYPGSSEPLLVEVIEGHGVLVVRPARMDDLAGLLSLYGQLSAKDHHTRFFSGGMPSQATVENWLGAAAKDGFTVLAEIFAEIDAEATDDGNPGSDGSSRIVAEAGFTLLSNGDGEFAVTVAADWRGWLGPYLLDVIIRAAADRGVPNLEAEVLTRNAAMLKLARSRGCAVIDHDDWSTIRLTMGTSGGVPSWPGNHDRPRILIEGVGSRWYGTGTAQDADCEVMVCAGPAARSVRRCPVLDGQQCPLAQEADVIVCALPEDDMTTALIEGHAQLHPGVPVRITRRGDRVDDHELVAEVVERFDA